MQYSLKLVTLAVAISTVSALPWPMAQSYDAEDPPFPHDSPYSEIYPEQPDLPTHTAPDYQMPSGTDYPMPSGTDYSYDGSYLPEPSPVRWWYKIPGIGYLFPTSPVGESLVEFGEGLPVGVTDDDSVSYDASYPTAYPTATGSYTDDYYYPTPTESGFYEEPQETGVYPPVETTYGDEYAYNGKRART